MQFSCGSDTSGSAGAVQAERRKCMLDGAFRTCASNCDADIVPITSQPAHKRARLPSSRNRVERHV